MRACVRARVSVCVLRASVRAARMRPAVASAPF